MMGTRAAHEGERRCWRVFYTGPRVEKRCETYLLDEGIEAFLPKTVAVRQWSDRKRKVMEPLFPNYLFAHVDERERLQVLQAPGVVRCVGFGGQLTEVDPAEIEQLKILQNAPERLIPVGLPLPPVGERITVASGPLRGLVGEVVGHRGRLYVVVRVEAVQQAIRAHVPVHELVGAGTGIPSGSAAHGYPYPAGAWRSS